LGAARLAGIPLRHRHRAPYEQPAADTRGAIPTGKVKHHAPLDRGTLPMFFAALGVGGLERTTEIAIRLLAYVFVRPGELQAARWTEFDRERAEWRIRPSG